MKRHFCPVHFPEPVGMCSDICLAERNEFHRLCALLRNYWRERRNGMRPDKVARRTRSNALGVER